jgi:hypothetical protein
VAKWPVTCVLLERILRGGGYLSSLPVPSSELLTALSVASVSRVRRRSPEGLRSAAHALGPNLSALSRYSH